MMAEAIATCDPFRSQKNSSQRENGERCCNWIAMRLTESRVSVPAFTSAQSARRMPRPSMTRAARTGE
jgi:hypothetical protein